MNIFKSLKLLGSGLGSTFLHGSIYLVASNSTIAGFTVGCFELCRDQVSVSSSPYFRADRNVISNNTIVGMLFIQDARDTILTDNLIKNSLTSPPISLEDSGLQIDVSPGSLLRRNVLDNDTTFHVFGLKLADYVQDIDKSNTIGGLPICYFVEAQSPDIPELTGYLGLVKTTNVTLGPRSIQAGVQLAGTRNVEIEGLRTARGVDVVLSYNTLVQDSTFAQSGITISDSDLTVIRHNVISTGGVLIANSTNTQVLGNNIVAVSLLAFSGIALKDSTGNILADNFVSNFGFGLYLQQSSFNQIEHNVIHNTFLGLYPLPRYGTGILAENSPQNTFKENQIGGAISGLEVVSYHTVCTNQECQIKPQVNDYVQDLDPSNTIDGRPIYYLVGAHGANVPADAGYIAIVNSTQVRVNSPSLSFSGDGIHIVASTGVIIENANITASDFFGGTPEIWAWNSHGLTIRNNRELRGFGALLNSPIGISLEDCWNATVEGNIIFPSFIGIALYNSTYAKIDGNYVSKYSYGILLVDSNDNIVARNTLLSYGFGILLTTGHAMEPGTHGSFNNLIIENTIADNEVGLEVGGFGNTIYHNNFLNNYEQAIGMNNTWDNGAGQGNYWSDYKGQDLDGDGIGDTLVPHLGLDNYPLTSPWTPNGLSSTFARRGAWVHVDQTSSSVKNDVVQTLFAAARNNGRSPEWIQAVFNITSLDGVTRMLFTMPVWVSTGQSVILSAPVTLSPGTYSISVQLRFSGDAFEKWTVAGTRTASVNVR